MTKKDVRVAQIGVGALGGAHLDALYDDIEDANVVAAYDPIKFADDETRTTFEAQYPGITAYPQPEHAEKEEQEVLHYLVEDNDVEAANIVTPHVYHYDQAKQLLEDDVNVHVEKPVTTDPQDAVALQELAEDQDLVLQPGYQRAVNPVFLAGEQAVQDDMAVAAIDPYQDDSYRDIGDIKTVNAYIKQNWWEDQNEEWRANGEFSGSTEEGGEQIGWGMAGDTGSHLLQSVLQMTKASPKTATVQMDTRIGSGDYPVDVNSAWQVELEQEPGNTFTANLTINGDGAGYRSEGIEIYGQNGEVTLEEINDDLTLRINGEPQDIDGPTDYHELNRLKLEGFVDSVKHDRPPVVPTVYGTQVTALHEASYLSELRDDTVDVEQLLKGTAPTAEASIQHD